MGKEQKKGKRFYLANLKMNGYGFGKSRTEETRVEIYSTPNTFDSPKTTNTTEVKMFVSDNNDSETSLMSNYGKETFSIVTDKFMESTSAHGFNQVKLRKKSIAKLFWIIVLLVAFTALGTHLCALVEKYFDYGYEETTELLMENPLFPDVTICNMDAISSDRYINSIYY